MSDFQIDHPREEDLHAYLDGELSAGETGALEEHLEECGACREQLAGIVALFGRIESLADEPLEADFAPALTDRLERTANGRSLRWLLPLQLAVTGMLGWLALPDLTALGQRLLHAAGIWTAGLDLAGQIRIVLGQLRMLADQLPGQVFNVSALHPPGAYAAPAFVWWLLLLGGVLWFTLNRALLAGNAWHDPAAGQRT